MQAAQARNQREAITGVLLYDEGQFFQWLEGPADGIGRVMRSICSDTRHTDLELLYRGPTPERHFVDWDMKLAVRNVDTALRLDEVIEPSFEFIQALQRHPRRAASHLLQLAKRPAHSGLVTPALNSVPLRRR